MLNFKLFIMKKVLLSVVLLATLTSQAQVLESENYDALTIGPLGANTDGNTPGQGDIYAYNGSASDYNIVAIDAAHGKSLQIASGDNATAASNRYVFKDGTDLANAWADRTAGNDFIFGKFEVYTGTSIGATRTGSCLISALGDSYTGFVGATYNSSTKQINAMMYLSGAQSGFYSITGISDTTYPANTWVTIQYAYDYNTGDTYIKIGGEDALKLGVNNYYTVDGFEPVEHDIINWYASGNNASNITAVDNYEISAKASAEDFLGAREVKGNLGNEIAVVYPNPATDVLNISYSKKVKGVEIFDSAGKRIKVNLTDNKVDVKVLPKGVYIININTGDDVQTQKFIKK